MSVFTLGDLLRHHGIKGQKWGVRRTPEELGHVKDKPPINDILEKSKARSTMDEEGFTIHRSVGAKAKNYEVLDPVSSNHYPFVEGTRIKNPTVFAGKGGIKRLHEKVAQGLSKQIGGKPENWQHCKGIGTINFDGEEREAEVHWFQEQTVGKHRFKIKKWLDE